MEQEFYWHSIEQPDLPAFVRCAGTGSRSPQRREGWLLVYMDAGSSVVEAEEQTQELEPGAALWVQQAVLHLKPGSQCRFAYLEGQATKLLPQTEILYGAGAGQVRDVLAALIKGAQLGLLDDQWKNSGAAYEAVMQCCAIQRQDDDYPALVRDAISLIQERYPYLFGVEDLAELLGVSKHHLIRTFTASVGVSTGQYLKEVRLKNAAALLQSGRYSVGEVAGMVGYAEDNYFCKVFRARFGVSPGVFRAQKPLKELDASPKEEIFYL